jgi:hypothetical protein
MRFKYLLIVLSITLLNASCCDKADTFRLVESEIQFIPYEINDILRYKNLESEEITKFVVIEERSEIFEESGSNYSGLPDFCPRSDDSYEEKTIKLESENCFMEYSVSVLGNPAGIRFSIGSTNCNISSFGSTINNGVDILYQDGTYIVEGILYEPVYQLNNSTSRVLVTPGIGVLSFTDDVTGEEYVFVE